MRGVRSTEFYTEDPVETSDLKKYRLTAATMIKFMIRARRQGGGSFMPGAQWRRWWNTAEPKKPAPIRVLLQRALDAQGRLNDIKPLDSLAEGERENPTLFDLVDRFIEEQAVIAAIQTLDGNPNAAIEWERLAEWSDLEDIRDGLDRLPGDKPTIRRKGGRPLVSEEEATDRQALVAAWNKARGVASKKDFCADKGITVKALDRVLDWAAKRSNR